MDCLKRESWRGTCSWRAGAQKRHPDVDLTEACARVPEAGELWLWQLLSTHHTTSISFSRVHSSSSSHEPVEEGRLMNLDMSLPVEAADMTRRSLSLRSREKSLGRRG